MICQHCGQPFTGTRRQAFCSKQCRWNYEYHHRLETKTISCDWCNCEFTVGQADFSRRFCSKSCRTKYDNNVGRSSPIYPRQCEWCQEWFTGKRSDQVCCSPTCRSRNWLGLSGKILDVAHIKETPLTPSEIGILVGSLLGDSSFNIVAHAIHAGVQTSHSPKQVDYLRWKVSLLPHLYHSQEPSSAVSKYYGTTSHRSVTLRHPDITRLSEMMRRDGRKAVTREILSLLTPLGIAIWWQDDGSYSGNPTWSTNSFSHDENKLIVQWFSEVHNIRPVITNHKRRQTSFGAAKESWSLRFHKGEWLKLKAIIEPHIHPSMSYKIGRVILPAD